MSRVAQEGGDSVEENNEEKYQIILHYERWVDGLHFYSEQHKEEMTALEKVAVEFLASLITRQLEGRDLTGALTRIARVSLHLGYYLGKHGIDSTPLQPPADFVLKELSDGITPGCDCDSCRAKLQLLKEAGAEYKMNPEQEEAAKAIREIEAMVNMQPKNLHPKEN